MTPFDDERFEHQHRVDIVDGDAAEVDAKGPHAHGQRTERGDRTRRQAERQRAAQVCAGGTGMGFDRQSRLGVSPGLRRVLHATSPGAVTRSGRDGHVAVTAGPETPPRSSCRDRRRSRPNAAAVRLDEVLHDRQAEPGPALGARAAGVHAIEALEDPRQVFRRDADAGVAHADRNAARRRAA